MSFATLQNHICVNLFVFVMAVCSTDRFFNDSSLEERGHAEKFMEYQVQF